MRYLPHTERDRQRMLDTIGVKNVDALFQDVPASAYKTADFDLPTHLSEREVESQMRGLARENLDATRAAFFCGAGVYYHHVPAAVDFLCERAEFLTAYTPYQPEVAQGTLQTVFEFQTQVCLLTGMEVANASLYDGGVATAEAVMMAVRRTKRSRAVLSGGLHPDYVAITQTHARFNSFHVVAAETDPWHSEDLAQWIDDDTACVVVQYPSFYGHLHDYTRLAEICHARGAMLIVAVTEIMALGALTPPGEFGADIVAAEGQSLGNPMGFGGPHVGLFATKRDYLRQMPGRLAGQTVDADGRPGWVLTLSTREQHIRREKATSNVCTNSGLCATAFTIHLALLGEHGYTRLAELNHAAACQTADELAKLDRVKVLNDSFFNEFVVQLDRPAAPVAEQLAARGVLAGVPVTRLLPERDDMADLMLVAATEMTTEADRQALVQGLQEVLQ